MAFIPLPFLLVAVYIDFKERKIKNVITYPLILLGLISNALQAGLKGAISSLLGILIVFIVVSILPGFRHGGGDTKLAMGIGSFIGSNHILYFLFNWFLFSLLICNIKLLKNKGFNYFKNTVITELITSNMTRTEGLSNIIGAPMILLGYLVTLLFFKT